MDQKQLDDLESGENEDSFSQEKDTFSDSEEFSEDRLEDQGDSETFSEEKVNDVNDILENNEINQENEGRVEVLGDEGSTEMTPSGDELRVEEETEEVIEADTTSNYSSEPTGPVSTTESKVGESKVESSWDSDEGQKSPKSSWRLISGVLLILLVVAVYTNGFNFTGAAVVDSGLTLIDAEDKVLDYVNSNLLQPPFTAEVVSSEETNLLFKVTLDITGQEIDTYLTKDGQFFFPQGFDLEAPLDLGLGGSEVELVDISIEGDPVLGDGDAPVTIVEFSDFQCPYCQKGWETMKQVEEKYVDSGKVKIVFKDFPLSFHDQAKPAALAAECAHEQGKYWEYHDLLFENQDVLGVENFKKWAADLGLDTKQFDDCLASEKYLDEVDADFADGQSYGVSGTPAFFVNGVLISGAQPFEVFEQVIEAALASPSEEVEEVGEAVEETEEVVEEVEETEMAEATTKEIQIDVKKWRFDPKHIEVNQGDEVKLVISSEELDLKFILSAFSVSETLAAGDSVTVEFTADKKGTFDFLCGDYCLSKYGTVQGGALKGELVVS